MAGRTPIGKFIHTTWTNLNIRCGKYKHLRTENKCKNYENINICFDRKWFKQWCLKQETYILSLERPSINRINSSEDYTKDNIRVIELKDNIANKGSANLHINGVKANKQRGIRKIGNKYQARISIAGKEVHIGMYSSELEAYQAYKNKFFGAYNIYPW